MLIFSQKFRKKMAANIKGKYTLRTRLQDLDETLDLNQGIDSDIDEEGFEEDDEPLINLVTAAVNEEFQQFPVNDQHQNIENHEHADTDTPEPSMDSPDGWDISFWKEGSKSPTWIGDFSREAGLLINIPEDANELDFFKIFLTNDVLESITNETNEYARNYIESAMAANNLKESSRFKLWPEDGISVDDMKSFIALSFYFGLVNKENVKSYWSTDGIYDTPLSLIHI